MSLGSFKNSGLDPVSCRWWKSTAKPLLGLGSIAVFISKNRKLTLKSGELLESRDVAACQSHRELLGWRDRISLQLLLVLQLSLPPSLEAWPLLLANQVLCAAAGEHEIYQDWSRLCVPPAPVLPLPQRPPALPAPLATPCREPPNTVLCAQGLGKVAPQQRSSWPWGKVVLIIIITIKRILSLLVILNMSLKISLIFLLFLNPSLLQSGDYVSSSHFTF